MEVKELNEMYEKVMSMHEETFKYLKGYVHGMLKLHGGSIGIDVKDIEECEEDGVEYYDQFPCTVDIDGQHEMFSIYLTKVFSNGASLFVDGVRPGDFDDDWFKELSTREDYETYYTVAYFINEVLEHDIQHK